MTWKNGELDTVLYATQCSPDRLDCKCFLTVPSIYYLTIILNWRSQKEDPCTHGKTYELQSERPPVSSFLLWGHSASRQATVSPILWFYLKILVKPNRLGRKQRVVLSSGSFYIQSSSYMKSNYGAVFEVTTSTTTSALFSFLHMWSDH